MWQNYYFLKKIFWHNKNTLSICRKCLKIDLWSQHLKKIINKWMKIFPQKRTLFCPSVHYFGLWLFLESTMNHLSATVDIVASVLRLTTNLFTGIYAYGHFERTFYNYWITLVFIHWINSFKKSHKKRWGWC